MPGNIAAQGVILSAKGLVQDLPLFICFVRTFTALCQDIGRTLLEGKIVGFHFYPSSSA